MRVDISEPHPWDVTAAEAIAIQKDLREKIRTEDDLGEVETVAGVDVGFKDGGRTTCAAIAVLGFPGLEPREEVYACVPTQMPYIPGLLSFREIPAILTALEKLDLAPDLLLCDGQGIAHPRRLGLATHLGLITDMPSIGVAKSRLTGEHQPVPPDKGAWVPLMDKNEKIGIVLRTRSNVKPLYISVGHRISLDTARKYVMACLTRYRLPETTRRAHKLASGTNRHA